MTLDPFGASPAPAALPRFVWSAQSAVDLVLRPDRFFRSYLAGAPGIPWMVVWLCGMGASIDSFDTRLWLAEGLGRNLPQDPAWRVFWPGIAAAGVLTGAVVWLLRGWWFRMRLLLSRAESADPRTSRLVFIHAEVLWAAALVAFTLIQTPLHADYRALAASGSFSLSLIVLPFWAIYVGYRGVRSVFRPDVRRARFWFLILPLCFRGLVLVAAFGWGVAQVL